MVRRIENQRIEATHAWRRDAQTSKNAPARRPSRLDDVFASLEPLLKKPRSTHPAYKATMSSNTRGAVLIMCVNWGNLDLA